MVRMIAVGVVVVVVAMVVVIVVVVPMVMVVRVTLRMLPVAVMRTSCMGRARRQRHRGHARSPLV